MTFSTGVSAIYSRFASCQSKLKAIDDESDKSTQVLRALPIILTTFVPQIPNSCRIFLF